MGGQRPARIAGLCSAAALSAALVACSGGADEQTEIVFFQFKPEAVDFFTDVAERFEAENPDIRVTVDNVPSAETALRIRLVKEDPPEVLTFNANGTFGEFASAGVFADFSDSPLLEGVNPAYVEVIRDLGAGEPGAVNGIPFAANASGALYNVELFAEHGREVPQTWTELIETAEYFEGQGVVPFYAMLADAWTAQSPMAPLTAQLAPEDFFEQRFAGETTFREGWLEAMDRLGTLSDYTQPDPAASGYEQGPRAFAAGESAMLLIGSYADDPALTGVQDLIAEGRIVGFTDHQFIQAIPLGPLIQQYLLDRDAEAFVDALDANWDRVAQRRTWGLGAVQDR